MDIVFCADDALLGQPESRAMGEIHTFGLWPIHMGMRKTKEWLFTGDKECCNAEQNFTNVYWVQTAPPRIVQSRQWAGDFNGMLVMRDVDR